jgi:hypothetical protein
LLYRSYWNKGGEKTHVMKRFSRKRCVNKDLNYNTISNDQNSCIDIIKNEDDNIPSVSTLDSIHTTQPDIAIINNRDYSHHSMSILNMCHVSSIHRDDCCSSSSVGSCSNRSIQTTHSTIQSRRRRCKVPVPKSFYMLKSRHQKQQQQQMSISNIHPSLSSDTAPTCSEDVINLNTQPLCSIPIIIEPIQRRNRILSWGTSTAFKTTNQQQQQQHRIGRRHRMISDQENIATIPPAIRHTVPPTSIHTNLDVESSDLNDITIISHRSIHTDTCDILKDVVEDELVSSSSSSIPVLIHTCVDNDTISPINHNHDSLTKVVPITPESNTLSDVSYRNIDTTVQQQQHVEDSKVITTTTTTTAILSYNNNNDKLLYNKMNDVSMIVTPEKYTNHSNNDIGTSTNNDLHLHHESPSPQQQQGKISSSFIVNDDDDDVLIGSVETRTVQYTTQTSSYDTTTRLICNNSVVIANNCSTDTDKIIAHDLDQFISNKTNDSNTNTSNFIHHASSTLTTLHEQYLSNNTNDNNNSKNHYVVGIPSLLQENNVVRISNLCATTTTNTIDIFNPWMGYSV